MTSSENANRRDQPPPWVKGLRLTVFAVLMLAVWGMGSLSRFYAQDFLTPNNVTAGESPADLGLPMQDVQLSTSDGVQLTGWYVPPPAGSDDVLLYLHGIGSNRGHFVGYAAELYDAGYGGLLLNMRGHGTSDAVPRTMGIREVRDVQAAVDYLLAQPGVSQVGLMGASFGASAGLIAAQDIEAIETIVAFSPYSSLADVVGDRAWQMYRLPPRPPADFVLWWMWAETGENIYRAAPTAALQRITERPVLHVHGTADRTIPYAGAERILDVAGGERHALDAGRRRSRDGVLHAGEPAGRGGGVPGRDYEAVATSSAGAHTHQGAPLTPTSAVGRPANQL